MVSDDSMFNGIQTKDHHNKTVFRDNSNNKLSMPRKIRDNKGLHNRVNNKENFTYLNNISKVSNVTISNSVTSSKSSSEKKKLMLKNRRFEKRPPNISNRSNNSSLQLSSIPYTMSENNILSKEDVEPNIIISKGIRKVREDLNSHFHNRHMSNPANFGSPLNTDKNAIANKAQASSRLIVNRQSNNSRVSQASNLVLQNTYNSLSHRDTKMSKLRSPSSITNTTNIQEKIENIMKTFNEDKAN